MSNQATRHHANGGRRSILTWIAVVAAVAGIVALVIFIRAQQSPPVPPKSAAGTTGVNPAVGTGSHSSAGQADIKVGGAHQHPLAVSDPRTLDIPAINVHTDVIAVGKNSDGTIEVPQPGPNLNKAAWYDSSPTPGRIGPSVIVGHVDTTEGPSVFFDLGDVRPGDKIRVGRADGSVVVYTVDGVRDYPQKSDFPTALVYGGDLTRPSLRIVTCANFDSDIGHYLGNIVVFAHLTAAHHIAS